MDYAIVYKEYKIDYATDLRLCVWCCWYKNLFVVKDTSLTTIPLL